MVQRPTNQDIFDYYSKRNKHELSDLYFKLNPPKNDPYETLYYEFCTADFQNEDDRCLYNVLSIWTNSNVNITDIHHNVRLGRLLPKSELTENLADLSDVTGIDFLHPDNNPGKVANQKWHLFVGVLAYLRVCGSYVKQGEIAWNWDRIPEYKTLQYPLGKYPSKVLRLWMIENTDREKDKILDLKHTIQETLELKASTTTDSSKQMRFNEKMLRLNGRSKSSGQINELFTRIMESDEIRA